ncbi:MAG: NAD(+) synthase, partial [Planctomycetota bacterium]
TLYGDMNGGLAVISDVPKSLVFDLCRYMNEHHHFLGFTGPPIPEATIDKPPSAELAPGQLDTDSLPPYVVLDEIIDRHVERLQTSDTIAHETGFDRSTVDRICRLIDLNEHKRKQYAVGLKVTTVAFGRGRRMPIVQRWKR